MDWPKEIDAYSQSGVSQPQYCKEREIKYTTYRYHRERRFKSQDKDGFVEVPNSVVNVSS
ncbi:IS66 family insertion sequence element accessory protein TnpA, partial [Leptospira weilii]|uniref:IS66 family insertion sequence element accessory protein TnpA n=1 Tax=Leptospira weilii TaxID=28184 RepID=UPI003B97FE86